jgi:hypothetical protein
VHRVVEMEGIGVEGEVSPNYIARCRKALKERGAPLDGWRCVEVIDFESESFACELCGYPTVRYIHVMSHCEYPSEIHVGCVCAGIMEGDMLAAKKRDAEARNRSQRKAYYLKKEWTRVSPDRWELTYKKLPLIIERADFRGVDYYKIDVDGDQYQWKDNRRIISFSSAQSYIFDCIERDRGL